MVHRLVNIPMNKKDFEIEQNTIINIAKFNGHVNNIIVKLIKKHKWSRNIRNISTVEPQNLTNRNRADVIFYPQISHKISKI